MALAHNLGFPRLGYHQETLKTTQAYCQGQLSELELKQYAIEFQKKNWKLQSDAGLDIIPVGDFFDPLLDTTILLGNTPPRFHHDGNSVLDTLFCMALGETPTGFKAEPCKKAQWFDTHYQYIVPEFSSHTHFHLQTHDHDIFTYTQQALDAEYCVKPVILGPLSFLWLSKGEDAFDKLALLEELIPVYREIFARFQKMGIEWLQVDEPILSLDLPEAWRKKFRPTYKKLRVPGLKCLLASYFLGLNDQLALTLGLEVDGFHLDCCREPDQLGKALTLLPKNKILSAGIVDGRNVWCNDFTQSLNILETIHASLGDRLWIAPSCSLVHVPLDLDQETHMDPDLKPYLAFAKQKVEEVGLLNTALNAGRDSIQLMLEENKKNRHSHHTSAHIHRLTVQQRLAEITPTDLHRAHEHSVRKTTQSQPFHLPPLPATMIGSFSSSVHDTLVSPSDGEKREGIKTDKEIHECIAETIAAQVDLDLDLLTHGTAGHLDSMEYLADCLEGIRITENGWIQVNALQIIKPPIIYGDIRRKCPITAPWTQYAQSLTTKPIKSVLPGPFRLMWQSFVRDDQPHEQTAAQIALALRDEIQDLEQAGIHFIEIDESTLVQGLPLTESHWLPYLIGFVKSFKLATGGVKDHTQIHVYFGDCDITRIAEALMDLDADVLILGNHPSTAKTLEALKQYPNDIAFNIYHSDSLQSHSVSDMENRLQEALGIIPMERLWVTANGAFEKQQWPEQALQDVILAISRVRLLHMSHDETSIAIGKDA